MILCQPCSISDKNPIIGLSSSPKAAANVSIKLPDLKASKRIFQPSITFWKVSVTFDQVSVAHPLIFSQESPRNAVNFAHISRPVSVLVKKAHKATPIATTAAIMAIIGLASIAVVSALTAPAAPLNANVIPLPTTLTRVPADFRNPDPSVLATFPRCPPKDLNTPPTRPTVGPNLANKPPALASPGNNLVNPLETSSFATPNNLKCLVVSATALPSVPIVPAIFPIGPTTAFADARPTNAITRALTAH